MMLQGKVGIVTGATAGLGRAAAIAMAREGAAVMLAGRNRGAGAEAVEEIRRAGGRAVFEVVDVVDERALERMVARTVSEFGRLDIAYNNAGVEAPRARSRSSMPAPSRTRSTSTCTASCSR